MKLAVLGKGGAGKSVVISLLRSIFSCEVYYADYISTLRVICPPARKYTGTVIEPALVEFPRDPSILEILISKPDFKIVIVTTPDKAAVYETKKILESLERTVPNEVLGVVVNKSDRKGKLSRSVASELDLKLLGSIPLSPKLEDHLVAGDISSFDLGSDRELRDAVFEFGRNLRLKEWRKKKERRGGFLGFLRNRRIK